MNIGEKMKQIRKAKKIGVDKIANELGVSVSTIYRYEDSSIEKIPVHIFDKLCTILEVSAGELMGGEQRSQVSGSNEGLPQEFHSPQEAMEFMVKLPMLAAYGGYDQVQHITYPSKKFDGVNYVELYLPARTAVVLEEVKK